MEMTVPELHEMIEEKLKEAYERGRKEKAFKVGNDRKTVERLEDVWGLVAGEKAFYYRRNKAQWDVYSSLRAVKVIISDINEGELAKKIMKHADPDFRCFSQGKDANDLPWIDRRRRMAKAIYDHLSKDYSGEGPVTTAEEKQAIKLILTEMLFSILFPTLRGSKI